MCRIVSASLHPSSSSLSSNTPRRDEKRKEQFCLHCELLKRTIFSIAVIKSINFPQKQHFKQNKILKVILVNIDAKTPHCQFVVVAVGLGFPLFANWPNKKFNEWNRPIYFHCRTLTINRIKNEKEREREILQHFACVERFSDILRFTWFKSRKKN